MYFFAKSERESNLFLKNKFLLFFHKLKCKCIPDPLTVVIGFGIKETKSPNFLAILFKTYFAKITESAIVRASE